MSIMQKNKLTMQETISFNEKGIEESNQMNDEGEEIESNESNARVKCQHKLECLLFNLQSNRLCYSDIFFKGSSREISLVRTEMTF